MNGEKYEKAKARVKELKHFYRNLTTYVAVNILLIIINLLTYPGRLWFYWVSVFWGFFILLHGLKVFLFKGKFLGKEWEEKKVKEIMRRFNKSLPKGGQLGAKAEVGGKSPGQRGIKEGRP